MSMADILAAARGKGGAAAPAGKAEAAPVAEKPAAKPAAARPAAEEPAAAAAPSKVAPGGKGMSMAEILAAARGKGGTAPAAKSAPPPAKPVQESAPAAEEPVAEEPAAEAPAPKTAAAAGGGSLKGKVTSVAEQVAYCRKTDAK
jgi:hypothetical protein